ncbi:hypothetical protein H4O18_11905 [Arenibacter sp. BSSL-BM3]|uniref:Right handed beta helix region n=1 Tax=Arenibacter arenosicollis TaxID=2762274 RepID=A0ABR7QNA9_9FLAO|nr:hypothetical protein [Arenibacter arenosicollis]MBC8768699.1 hypothetical protein [Arenibacter arenosicollis]
MKRIQIIYFLIAVICFSVSYAQGEIRVSSLADDNNEGTLRRAIITANADTKINEIIFDTALKGTISLTSNLPNVTSNMVIRGSGADNITISGAGEYRMFVIESGFTLDISGITFTDSANNYNNGTIFDVSGSSVIATEIVVTGISNQTAFWSKGDNSTITISNSIFKNNTATLFRSYWGSTPNFTSDNESDYTNRITVTESTFSYNRDLIFSTERYVKINKCNFIRNYGQIASFRGVNRYQVLNSTFVNNTGRLLFTFSSKIGDTPSWGEDTLGVNNTLFDGNLFQGNTGTILNTGGGFKHDSKTTITNNIFVNNGKMWYGNPIVESGNQQNNFVDSVSPSEDDSTVFLNLNKSLLIKEDEELH